MKLKFLKHIIVALATLVLTCLTSCQDDNLNPQTLEKDAGNISQSMGIKTEELKDITQQDIEDIRSRLMKEGYDLSGIQEIQHTEGNETRGVADIVLKTIKVTCKTNHPDGSGRKITVSGVLLVPRQNVFNRFTSYQLLVAPPPTYTANSQSPSELFKKGINLINIDWDNNLKLNVNMFAAFALQAASGYAVLFIDYPGFGDSYKECTIPYLENKPLMSSTIDLIKATRLTLSANGYRYKNDLAITGYSQGAFVATSLARELETNKSHGLNVSILIAGGTPCNLKQIVDIVRRSERTVHTYFVPYAIWAYKQNGYPFVNISDILKEPYASKLAKVYDGTIVDPNEMFPHEISALYTKKFIEDLDTDPNLAYVNKVLEENSIKPWKNKCKFVMTHGVSDVSVYYQNAKDFADATNRVGGKVVFHNTVGNHIVGAVPYFFKASIYLGLN